VIDASSSPELLQVDAGHQAAQAVADQVDATPANVPPQMVAQGDRAALHALARPVVEGQDLAKPAPTQVPGEGQQGGSIRKIAVNQYDRSLFRLSRRRASWCLEAKRKQHSRRHEC
jgi:hypothetical protein